MRTLRRLLELLVIALFCDRRSKYFWVDSSSLVL